ncbi:MAG: GMP/IMP nucleotidase [Gammaproteobacteria bacterium]|nr:GMP/IMP nucleotidase [Gammaproteobacteria bacterium]
MIDWNQIHWVLLDMDGTLLDLHFDNHFWLEHMPRCYAKHKGLSPKEAGEELQRLCKRVEGTLNWSCLDYWTETLGMDVVRIKEEVAHLIAIRPYVIEFLDALHARGKRVLLVTNAHQKSLRLKMLHVPLEQHLDLIVSAHDLGIPKEAPLFWQRLQTREAFLPESTVLIDDTLPVLRSALQYGISRLFAVQRPDTRQPPREVTEFPVINSFMDIMPGRPKNACIELDAEQIRRR